MTNPTTATTSMQRKSSWRPFRRHKSKSAEDGGEDSVAPSVAQSVQTDGGRVRSSGGGLFRRKKKLNVVNVPTTKRAAQQSSLGPVIVPSHSFETDKPTPNKNNKSSTSTSATTSKKVFNLADELEEIKLNKVEHSMDTTMRDSLSSHQEDSLTGGDFDHIITSSPANKTNSPRREKRDVNETALGKSTLGGVTMDDVNRFASVNLYGDLAPLEISQESASQARTEQACGSPPRHNIASPIPEMESETEEEEQPQHDDDDDNDYDASETPSDDPNMPNEVVLGVPACSTNDELTVFSEDTADRALGISTPPAMKRNREPSISAEEELAPVVAPAPAAAAAPAAPPKSSSYHFTSQRDSFDPIKDKALRRLELQTLKKQLEEEKLRIKKQIDEEDAKMLGVERDEWGIIASRFAEAETKELARTPSLPTVDEAKPTEDPQNTEMEVQLNNVETAKTKAAAITTPASPAARVESNMEKETIRHPLSALEDSNTTQRVPGPSRPPKSQPPRAPEGATRRKIPMKATGKAGVIKPMTANPPAAPAGNKIVSEHIEVSQEEQTSLPTAKKTHHYTHDELAAEPPLERTLSAFRAGFEVPLLKRTTSDGSMGLENIKQDTPKTTHSRVGGHAGRSDSIAAETKSSVKHEATPSVPLARRVKGASSDEETSKLLSGGKPSRKARRKRRQIKKNCPEEIGRREREMKVRVVEDDLSEKEGVEMEHVAVLSCESESNGSVGSSSEGSTTWFGSRVSARTNMSADDDSHYDSDPDPFSGIEEQRMATLALALQNARQAVARQLEGHDADIDALANDPAAKRPGRKRFHRKSFFKGLKRSQKGKAKDPPGRRAPSDDTKKELSMKKQTPVGKPRSSRSSNKSALKSILEKPEKSNNPNEVAPIIVNEKATELVGHPEVFPRSTSIASKMQASTAAVDSDIETNVTSASNSNILNGVDVFEQERDNVTAGATTLEQDSEPAVVSDHDEESDGGASDDYSSSAGSQTFMTADELTVATFVHDYPLLMSVARTLSSTWAAGFSAQAAIENGAGGESISDEAAKKALEMARSFSFSNGNEYEDDDESCSSAGETFMSDDVLLSKGRFSCM